ncbi:MAG: LysR family transcriptional regulator [Proteobacteria bacterium]|nr:LysR family transcriptional regulator [Pseudomonadota bacterium]
MDDWNDLRLVLAVGRAGSLTGGAKALGVNHSTAFRRLNALEAKIGVRLFERLAAGHYLPTGAGSQAMLVAERMETETTRLGREIAGSDHRLTGRLRITSSETLAYRLLTAELARFRGAHPGIEVELAIDNRILSLSRREADVALRVTRPKEPDLYGRKLADAAWTLYGAPALLKALKLPRRTGGTDLKTLAAGPFIGWHSDADGIHAGTWLEAEVRAGTIVYRSNSLINQLAAAKTGIGLVLLPCYLGDLESGIARALSKPIPALARELWIVTHKDLKETARVRAFLDLVGAGLVAHKRLFAGNAAP